VLTFPLVSNAVAWCSAVFDVSATALVLMCVLTARRYARDRASAFVRVLLVVIGLAAFLSKETAAVTPLLVGLDAFAVAAVTPTLAIDLLGLSTIIGGIGLIRAAGAFAVGGSILSRYIFQRMLFGSFGALMVPWHDAVVSAHPVVPLSYGLMQVGLFGLFFVRVTPRRATRIVVCLCLWVVISIAPLLTFFFIGGDLQAARYLYLASIAWAAIMVTVIATLETFGTWGRRVGRAVLLTFVLFGVYGARLHQGPWTAAADLRDAVMQAARNSAMGQCRSVTISHAPDNVAGAFVFRNGLPEALHRELGITATMSDDPKTVRCAFIWDDTAKRFVSVR
jgi:hypothetical protein